MIFVALTCLQLGVALGLRPRQVTRENPMLPLAVLGSLLLAVAGVYVPLLQELLSTEALPAPDLLLAVGTGVVGWVAARVTRRVSAARRDGTGATQPATRGAPA